jgi:hypothetical protein
MKQMNTSDSTVILIRGIGHVPAFKNKKIIAGKRLVTAPKARQWMELATKDMYSKLKSLYQTGEGATSTEHWQQSAIASWPSDDNWQQIPQITVKVRRVEKGDEGAIVRLTKISPV